MRIWSFCESVCADITKVELRINTVLRRSDSVGSWLCWVPLLHMCRSETLHHASFVSGTKGLLRVCLAVSCRWCCRGGLNVSGFICIFLSVSHRLKLLSNPLIKYLTSGLMICSLSAVLSDFSSVQWHHQRVSLWTAVIGLDWDRLQCSPQGLVAVLMRSPLSGWSFFLFMRTGWLSAAASDCKPDTWSAGRVGFSELW